jgi:serine/threonine-protein kinase
MDRLLDRPFALAALGAVVVLLLLALRALKAHREQSEGSIPGLDGLLGAGHYEQAAALLLDHDRPNDAIELYLRAQKPGRAAQIAARFGNHRLAGELYERAGDPRRAAQSYQRAGMTERARELTPPEEAARTLSENALTSSHNDRKKTRRPDLVEPAVSAPAAQPNPEERFRSLLVMSRSDDVARMEMQQAAQSAAETALAEGDLRKAADIYRDAGLHDEAIHLYANVLGLPGDAAPLVAARGHHDRAAELYELAGQKERAASAWAELARRSGQPEVWVDRIERLDPKLALTVMEEAVSARPISRLNVKLHYRYAVLLETLGERVRALETYLSVNGAAGTTYLDTEQRVRELRRFVSSDVVPTPPRKATDDRRGMSGAELASPQVSTLLLSGRLSGREIPAEEVARIAQEAAIAAIKHTRRSSHPPPSSGRRTQRKRTDGEQAARGLESGTFSFELLTDAAVREAREGPSVEHLRQFTNGRPCNLQNIEVYYRLGLAWLAAGEWNAALECFDSVENTSAGYRDAYRRAGEIRRWQKAHGNKITLDMGDGSTAQSPSPSRYELRGELGRGGMAVVYRAVDTVLGRDVALKFLAEQALEKRELREMFQREARSVAQLNHPNIVTIHDFGVLDGRTFIAMEYVEGRTVDDLIAEQGHMPVVESLRVVVQVLDALEYAHGRQIIHRDIKPSNMMRSTSGLVKLMDFGLAKSVSSEAKSSMIIGTPAYMAPEQLSGGLIDRRTDLYAIGASLFEMLTGRLPFETFARPLEPPRASAVVSTIPAAVDEILRLAMTSDPDKRFQSAAEFASPIRRMLAAIDKVSATPPPTSVTSPLNVSRPDPRGGQRPITQVQVAPAPSKQTTADRPGARLQQKSSKILGAPPRRPSAPPDASAPMATMQLHGASLGAPQPLGLLPSAPHEAAPRVRASTRPLIASETSSGSEPAPFELPRTPLSTPPPA